MKTSPIKLNFKPKNKEETLNQANFIDPILILSGLQGI